MAITGTLSLSQYPLAPGATTSNQPAGINAPTFASPPAQGDVETLTYTNIFGAQITIPYRPTEMDGGDLVEAFRDAGVADADLDEYGRLTLPSGQTLTGTGTAAAYLGF